MTNTRHKKTDSKPSRGSFPQAIHPTVQRETLSRNPIHQTPIAAQSCQYEPSSYTGCSYQSHQSQTQHPPEPTAQDAKAKNKTTSLVRTTRPMQVNNLQNPTTCRSTRNRREKTATKIRQQPNLLCQTHAPSRRSLYVSRWSKAPDSQNRQTPPTTTRRTPPPGLSETTMAVSKPLDATFGRPTEFRPSSGEPSYTLFRNPSKPAFFTERLINPTAATTQLPRQQ